jgi:hypothetical protein
LKYKTKATQKILRRFCFILILLHKPAVIPVQAGIQFRNVGFVFWIPACAGVTKKQGTGKYFLRPFD